MVEEISLEYFPKQYQADPHRHHHLTSTRITVNHSGSFSDLELWLVWCLCTVAAWLLVVAVVVAVVGRRSRESQLFLLRGGPAHPGTHFNQVGRSLHHPSWCIFVFVYFCISVFRFLAPAHPGTRFNQSGRSPIIVRYTLPVFYLLSLILIINYDDHFYRYLERKHKIC